MSRGWTYNPGEHNAICDSCGRKFKSSQLKKRWDGLMVCDEDWNPRQTLDFVRTRADHQTPPWIRPQQQLVFNHVVGVYDDLFITDIFDRVVTYFRTPSESFDISENIPRPKRGLLVDESVNFSESNVLDTTKTLSEEFWLSDAKYFAEDYLENNDSYIANAFRVSRDSLQTESVGITETSVKSVGKVSTDSIGFTETGVITLPAYIDPTYFAADYLQTTQTF